MLKNCDTKKKRLMINELMNYGNNECAIESMDLIASLMTDKFIDRSDIKRLANIHTLLSAVAKAQRN